MILRKIEGAPAPYELYQQVARRCRNSFILESAKGRLSLYQHLAGRFAAKEAIFKAMGDRTLTWKDVQVFNDRDGKPYCKILNNKGKNLEVHVSISHVKNYAVANAIITPKK